MIFDKQLYRKRRNIGLSGQEVIISTRRIEKGESVLFLNREGIEVEFPNARGKELVFIRKQPVFLNREDARTREKGVHKGSKHGARHQINDTKLPTLVLGTNHDRMRLRSETRAGK